MKKAITVLITLAVPVFLLAQNSAVDKLFNKYSGKEGITTVKISPEVFQVIKAMEIDDIKAEVFPFEKVSSVKILTVEEEELWEGVNFYEEIKNDLDLDDFAEVMTVQDGGETVRMWMKVDQQTMSEFLLIVGGDDNVLVYIHGSFNMNDLADLAGSFDHDLDIHL